jgi:hypothetical protein
MVDRCRPSFVNFAGFVVRMVGVLGLGVLTGGRVGRVLVGPVGELIGKADSRRYP